MVLRIRGIEISQLKVHTECQKTNKQLITTKGNRMSSKRPEPSGLLSTYRVNRGPVLCCFYYVKFCDVGEDPLSTVQSVNPLQGASLLIRSTRAMNCLRVLPRKRGLGCVSNKAASETQNRCPRAGRWVSRTRCLMPF